MSDTFWVVWCVGGGSPTVKHDHFGRACAEAERLARNNPGREFVVLQSMRGFIKDDVRSVEYCDIDAMLPF